MPFVGFFSATVLCLRETACAVSLSQTQNRQLQPERYATLILVLLLKLKFIRITPGGVMMAQKSFIIHPLADVKTGDIGEETRIWQFCVVFKNAKIGKNCNICANVLIENDVTIGDNVTVKSGVQLWDGVIVEDNVFIGPNVTFTNDLIPRSKQYPLKFLETVLKDGCSIGANATIVAGHSIGEYALVGAESVITKDIPAHTIWYGNPAKQRGYITKTGIILDKEFMSRDGKKYELNE
jgi:acetyltransferase-like isoleucine patch superfamily enzyme